MGGFMHLGIHPMNTVEPVPADIGPPKPRGRSWLTIVLFGVITGTGVGFIISWMADYPNNSDEYKPLKAKMDCERIASSVEKFNSLEGHPLIDLIELKQRYLTTIDSLKDPWGCVYRLDTNEGIVYSKGPDRRDNPSSLNDKTNSDNIIFSYIHRVYLVSAKIEINPNHLVDAALAFDVLHLQFNTRIHIPEGALIDFISMSAFTAADVMSLFDKLSDPACPDAAFRWCEGSIKKYVPATDIFRKYSSDDRSSPAESVICAYTGKSDGASTYSGTVEPGKIYHTESSREIVFALPAGTSGSIIPGVHFINLTGNRRIPPSCNPIFRKFDDTVGGVMSSRPILIEKQ